jgi:protoporphyrinogen oxidase
MSNSIEFLKFPPLSLVDKFRLGFTIFYASRIKNWKKLEQKYVADWLKRFSGKNTFEKMWLPLLRSKLGDSYTKTSAAFIWATIQRMYAARRSGLKKEMFGYVPEGYARILSEFKKLLISEGVIVKTSHKTEYINPLEGNKLELGFADKSTFVADKVIVTIPSSFVPGICKDIPKQESQKHKAINYLGVVCASILLKKPLSSFYVTNITDQDIPFTGVIEMTALVDKSEFGNKNLVYLPKYVSPNDPIFNESDESVKNRFVDALLKMYPKLSKDDFLFTGIARAKNVFALSTLDYSENLPPKVSGVKNLFMINSAHITNGTLNVNETIKLAEESILEITSSL